MIIFYSALYSVGKYLVSAMVGQVLESTYLKGRESWFENSFGKKFRKLHLIKWLGAAVHVCHPSYIEKHK
jgi:hypothetical protein